jgi:hypothetical protein
MAAPAVLGYSGAAATNDRIVGPLVASIAIVTVWEVLRPMRRLNTAFGAWLILAPWLLGFPLPATLNSLLAGVSLIALSLIRGKRKQCYGGGWSALWKASGDPEARDR